MRILIAVSKVRQLLPAKRANAGFLLAFAGFLLFFLMLFVPTVYQGVKAVLLGGLLFGIFVSTLNGARFRIHRQVFFLFIFYSSMGMAYVLYGYLNGNPGAIRVSTVYVIWPLVYMVLVSAISQEWVFRGLAQVLIWSSIAISLYALYYLLYTLGIVPIALYLELDMGQAASFNNGFVEYNLYSISTLLFLFPFVTACLLIWSGERSPPVARKWLMLAFVLVTCASILSGRRALWLVIVLTPLLIAASLLFARQWQVALKTIPKFFPYFAGVIIASATALSIKFDIRPSAILNIFMEGFQFNSDASAIARSEQFFALADGWLNSPVFGAGLGAVAEGSIRSDEMPWAYELYFLSVLFQTGLVGFLAYAFGIGWIIFYGFRIIRRDPVLRLYMIPVLVGMLCFLIASNSNPYLAKFDYLWVVFLPVAMINYSLLKGHSAQPRGVADERKNVC